MCQPKINRKNPATWHRRFLAGAETNHSPMALKPGYIECHSRRRNSEITPVRRSHVTAEARCFSYWRDNEARICHCRHCCYWRWWLMCFVDWPLELPVFELVPASSQLVFEGDRFPLECYAADLNDEINVTQIGLHDSEMAETDRERDLILHTRRLPDRTHVKLNSWMHKVIPVTAHATSRRHLKHQWIEILVLSQKTVQCPTEPTSSTCCCFVQSMSHWCT